MYRRKGRSPFRWLLPALLVAVALWWARVWPFQPAREVTVSITSPVADRARDAYQDLSEDFRAKVSLDQFTGMYQHLLDPKIGPPVIRRASAVDAIGPERARAHFRVAYPEQNVKAEFYFELFEDTWQLQSFTRVADRSPVAAPSPLEPQQRPAPSTPEPTPTSPEPLPPARQGGPAQEKAAPAGPRYHVIQPGDVLTAISRKYYGTSRHWRRILEANPGLDPRRMRIGRKILIPSLPEAAPQDTPSPPGT